MGYSEVATDYRKAGWKGVLPLEAGKKSPVPSGFTGVMGAWPDNQQIQSWKRGRFKDGNVALRMPMDVVGIDVDNYTKQGPDGLVVKTGLTTLADLEAKWGKLPPTYTSGSREPENGGIRFYRVAEGVNLPGVAGKDIDIVQFHHRYAVVWPSVHPEGGTYHWRDMDGEVVDFIPSPGEFPELPAQWVAGLESNSYEVSREVDLGGDGVQQWLNAMRKTDDLCDEVAETQDAALKALSGDDGARHDATLKHVWRLLGLGAQGHAGSYEALEVLGDQFALVVGPSRAGGVAEAEREFKDMVFRGVRKRASVFTNPAPRCGCDAIAGAFTGQLRFAIRFAEENASRLAYVQEIGWLAYDGKRWVKDEAAPVQAFKTTIENAKVEARTMPPAGRSRLNQDVEACQGNQQVKGVLALASTEPKLAKKITDLDKHSHLFNLQSGTLNLNTLEVQPHDPADMITKITEGELGAEYGGDFKQFIERVLPDPEVRAFVQRLLGYAMLGEVKEHVLPIFTGTGANGKGTLLEAVKFAFGDYAIATDPALLIDQGMSHPTGQADLFGRRLAITSETNEKDKLAAATVKRLTGGDTVKARYMRKDFFEFEPSHTIIMMTNHKPEVDGADAAMWRRIFIVPFDVTIPAGERNAALPALLKDEASVILSWVFEGYKMYVHGQGLAAPEAVTERTSDYQGEMDPVQRFLDEATHGVEEGPGTTPTDLYRGYVEWARDNGEDPLNSVQFKESLERHGMKSVQSNGKRFYRELKSGFRLVLGEKTENPEGTALAAPPSSQGPTVVHLSETRQEMPQSETRYGLQEGEKW
jgi:putative DNA primase/helicase